MKRPKINLTLNCQANFRTNTDLLDKFAKKCKENNQFREDRLNLLIADDLGIPISFTPNNALQSLFDNQESPSPTEETTNV